MLRSLILEGYKSFAGSQRLPLGPLTVFVGPNGSGKSNAFDALRVLQGLALELTLDEVFEGKWDAQREVWPGVRGGAAEFAWPGASPRFVVDLAEGPLLYQARILADGKPVIDYESLCPPDGLDGPAPARHRGMVASQRISAHGPHLSKVIQLPATPTGRWEALVSSHRSALVQLAGAGLDGPPSPQSLDDIARWRRTLTGLHFFDPQPRRIRRYVSKHLRAIGTDGENLSAVLHRVIADEQRRADITSWLNELCGVEIANVDFSETEFGDVMLVVIDPAGRRISARSLSDGTLRFLALIVALLTAEPDTTLLIEEIETGLHPARLHLLVELLEHVTSKRGCQVICTTHSPAVLAALSPSALRDALSFARDPESGASKVSRLGDLPSFDEIVARRGIEELFTTRWLERAL